MSDQDFDTPGAALQHYGVLGMKWGKSRAQGSSTQVIEARSRNRSASTQIRKADRDAAKTADAGERAVKNKQVQQMKLAQLKNPDRVLAARTTAGEKAALVILATPPVAVLAISGASARSRRIERKQEKNKY